MANALYGPQDFKLYLRKTAGTPNPTVDVELWENGSFVKNLLNDTAISSTSGQLLTANWAASDLAPDNDGSLVECRVVSMPGQSAGAITRTATPTSFSTSTAGVTDWSFAHTCAAGTTLLLLTVLCEATESVSGTPTWNTSENFTLIRATTPGSAGDVRCYIYGLVNPTSGNLTVGLTMTNTGTLDNGFACAVSYLGTVSSSVANAAIFLDEQINDAAATTVAMNEAVGGVAGRTAFAVADFLGGDGDPAAETASGGQFAELFDSATGTSTTADISFWVGDVIGWTPATVTVDWTSTASDECCGIVIELVPGSSAVNTVEIGAIEWNAQYIAGAATVTITTSLQAAISKQLTIAASADAAISDSIDVSTSLEAAISIAGTISAATEALVQAALSASAALEGIATDQVDASVEVQAAISDLMSAATDLEGFIGTVGVETASLEAAIQAATTVATAMEALIQATQSVTTALEAVASTIEASTADLQALASTAIAITAGVEAAAQIAAVGTVGLQAAISAAISASTSLEANIAAAGESTVAASLQAAVIGFATVASALEAAASIVASTSLTFDAALAQRRELTVGLDAAILKALTAATSLEAVAVDDISASTAIEAWIGDVAAGSLTAQIEALISLARTVALQNHALIAAVPIHASAMEAFVGGIVLSGMRQRDAIGDGRSAGADGGMRVAAARRTYRGR